MKLPAGSVITEVQCGRCGSSMTWEDCWDCGGDGFHELYDTDPLYYDEDDVQRCDTCDGAGGWHVCLSTVDWCMAHPRPGHESVERSTVEAFTVTERAG